MDPETVQALADLRAYLDLVPDRPDSAVYDQVTIADKTSYDQMTVAEKDVNSAILVSETTFDQIPATEKEVSEQLAVTVDPIPSGATVYALTTRHLRLLLVAAGG
jgi:hypothetical protein